MPELTNPHDKFFKEILSREEVARDFLKNYLPPEVYALINTDSLELSKDTFVDKDLTEYFSDLLYKADIKDGKSAYIYILFEHKSYREPHTAFDLLRYMVRIWESVLKTESNTKFPVISIEDLEKALDEASPDKGGVLRPALVLYLLAALAVSQDISRLFRERA